MAIFIYSTNIHYESTPKKRYNSFEDYFAEVYETEDCYLGNKKALRSGLVLCR